MNILAKWTKTARKMFKKFFWRKGLRKFPEIDLDVLLMQTKVVITPQYLHVVNNLLTHHAFISFSCKFCQKNVD